MKFRKPLAGLLFATAIGASIATSYAYPQWEASAESEEIELDALRQPHLVQLSMEGQLEDQQVYYGTQLSFEVLALVVRTDGEEPQDDTGAATEETGEGAEPIDLHLEVSSSSLEEPLLLELPRAVSDTEPSRSLGPVLVMSCEERDLSACAEDVGILLELSRPLTEDEHIEGSFRVSARASGESTRDDGALPEVELALELLEVEGE